MNGTTDNGEKDIIYSRTIKAGKRIYYLDVKKNYKGDLYLSVTESKKVQLKNSVQDAEVVFEKHKIFLYKEDLNRFMKGLDDIVSFIGNYKENPSGKDSEDNT